MAFREVLKKQRSGGSGFISSVGSASMSSLRESADPRNYLFKSGSLLNALFPKVKGYQYKDNQEKIKTSGSNLNATLATDKLDGVIQRLDIVGKNTMVLPMMSRDMNIARQSLVKLVKLNGGTQRDKADRFFSRAKESENLYESKIGMKSASTSPTPAKKEDGGSLSGFLKSLFIGGALIAGIGKLLEIPEIKEALKGFLKGMIESVFNGIKEIVKIVFETEIEIAGFKLSLGTAIATTIAGFVGFKLAIAALTAYITSQIGGLGRGSPRGLPPTIPGGSPPGGPGGKLPGGKPPTIPGSTGGTALGVGGRVLGALGLGLSLYEIAKFAAEAEYGKRMSEGAGKLAPKAFKENSQPIIDLQKSGYTREDAKTVLERGSDRDIEKLGGRENIQKYIDNKTPSPASGAPAAKSTSAGMGGILDLIASAEAKDSDPYNSMNQGTSDGTIVGSGISSNIIGKNLTDMTVGEIMTNAASPNDGPAERKRKGAIFAAGRYQIIPSTLKGLVEKDKIVSKDEKFTPEVQDRLAQALIDQSGATKSINEGDLNQAQFQLAKVWAGLPVPAGMPLQSGKISTGSESFYGQGNKAKSGATLASLQNGGGLTTPTAQTGQVIASGSTPKVATLDLTQATPISQPGQVARPASMVSDLSTALADARAAFATNPIIINSPTGKMPASTMSQNSQQPQYTAPAVVDSEFAKLLVSRAV